MSDSPLQLGDTVRVMPGYSAEVSGLPLCWLDRAIKAEDLKPIGHGHGWRDHRYDVLLLAESLRSQET